MMMMMMMNEYGIIPETKMKIPLFRNATALLHSLAVELLKTHLFLKSYLGKMLSRQWTQESRK